MRYFRKLRARRRLKRGILAEASNQLYDGKIDALRYEEIKYKMRDSKSVDAVYDQMIVNEDALGAFDWTKLWEWLRQNWPTILRLVFTLVLLEPQDEE